MEQLKQRRRLIAISVAIPWPTILRLREMADKRGVTMPELIRQAVAQWLERENGGGK